MGPQLLYTAGLLPPPPPPPSAGTFYPQYYPQYQAHPEDYLNALSNAGGVDTPTTFYYNPSHPNVATSTATPTPTPTTTVGTRTTSGASFYPDDSLAWLQSQVGAGVLSEEDLLKCLQELKIQSDVSSPRQQD